MAGSGSEVIGVTAHRSGSLRLACVGVLGHALRLLLLAQQHGLIPTCVDIGHRALYQSVSKPHYSNGKAR
jgi:hypothetical protein